MKKYLKEIIIIGLAAVIALGVLLMSGNIGNSGEKTITVAVLHSTGELREFTLTTEVSTLADALIDAELVRGSMDQYGLYIKEADGELADYSVNGAYWALRENGVDLMSGASGVEINDGSRYELVYTVMK